MVDGELDTAMTTTSGWPWKHFKFEEFTCPCCGLMDVDDRVLSYCQHIRETMKIPIFINSGFRCEKHNKEIDGNPNSLHLTGKAVDISTARMSGEQKFELVELGQMIFSGGLGIAQTFIHLDIGPSRLWVYK